MAFLSNLLSAFTGQPQIDAAKQQQQFLANTLNAGRSDIAQGTGQAVGAVTGGAAAARPILSGAYGQARNDATNYGNRALGYIDAGTSGAQGALGGARDAYGNLVDKYGGATSLQLDALGANGPEGTARAQGAFQAGPGYQFNLEQQLEAINRARSAGGMLASGNTSNDAMRTASGLASQEYGGWLDRLGGYINPELAATQGVAGVDTNEANLLSQAGQNKAGIASNTGGLLSNLASNYGTQAAGLETGLGQQLGGIYTGGAANNVNLATGLAQPYANTYKTAADAQTAGSANIWGLAQNLAKLGVGAYGMA